MKKQWNALLLLTIPVILASCGETGVASSSSEVVSPISETGQSQPGAFDNLGGGGNASNVDEVSVSLPDTVEEEEHVVASDVNYDIDLANIDSTATAYALKNNVLSLKSAGVYRLTGTLNGAVEVKKEIAGDVTVILNNASILPLASQDNPGLCFKKQADGDSYARVLTLAAGTQNVIKNAAGDVSE